jgi:chemotaxis signal transduction protein
MNSYLTFRVVNEFFAVNVSNVMEIREYEQPKPVPQKVEFITGLIEFREEVIPLVNTGLKFSLGPVETSQNSVIVVLNVRKGNEEDTFRVAIMADTVTDVMEIQDTELKTIRQEYKPGYVAGSYTHEDTFILVIDPDKVFTENEIIEMDKILKAAREQ